MNEETKFVELPSAQITVTFNVADFEKKTVAVSCKGHTTNECIIAIKKLLNISNNIKKD